MGKLVSKIGIICGLKSEAKMVRRAFPDDRVDVVVSGANSMRAEQLATALCQNGTRANGEVREAVDLIISVGVSGGLLPAYQPGDLVIGQKVVTAHGEEYICDPDCLDIVKKSHRAAGINPSIIFGSDEIIASADEKSRIYKQTGAKSVDMESHGAARAASMADVPFLAIRAIADPADRVLPDAALGAVTPEGGTRVLGALMKAARNPIELSALMQLGADSKEGLKSLSVNLSGFLGVLLLGRDFG